MAAYDTHCFPVMKTFRKELLYSPKKEKKKRSSCLLWREYTIGGQRWCQREPWSRSICSNSEKKMMWLFRECKKIVQLQGLQLCNLSYTVNHKYRFALTSGVHLCSWAKYVSWEWQVNCLGEYRKKISSSLCEEGTKR